MAFDKSGLDDYIDVATRIQMFKAEYPNGSLATPDVQFFEFGGKSWVMVTAEAYRDQDDKRPGVGVAYEQIPGKTPYTLDSELEVCQTSAWGRAVVAVGIIGSKKIATSTDLIAREAERDVFAVKRVIAYRLKGVAPEEISERVATFLGKPDGEWTAADLRRFVETLPGQAEANAQVDHALSTT